MKKMIAFVLILIFSLVFVLSYMNGIAGGSYARPMNIIGQIGLAVSVLLFFIFADKKKPPSKRNDAL